MKYNMAYRRFRQIGKDRDTMDFAFFAIAFNLKKLCAKLVKAGNGDFASLINAIFRLFVDRYGRMLPTTGQTKRAPHREKSTETLRKVIEKENVTVLTHPHHFLRIPGCTRHESIDLNADFAPKVILKHAKIIFQVTDYRFNARIGRKDREITLNGGVRQDKFGLFDHFLAMKMHAVSKNLLKSRFADPPRENLQSRSDRREIYAQKTPRRKSIENTHREPNTPVSVHRQDCINA
jgi:hypothetical protein